MNNFIIIEQGNELDFSEEEVKVLEELDLVYPAEWDMEGNILYYHTNPETVDDVLSYTIDTEVISEYLRLSLIQEGF